MTQELENELRNKFCKILMDLAESQTFLKSRKERLGFYLRLEEVYCTEENGDEFRHYYNDIFSVLVAIQRKGLEIDILGQNIDILKQKYNPQNPDGNGGVKNITNCIRKLYDHVNLDIARIKYSDAVDWKLAKNSDLKLINSNMKTIENKVKETEKSVKKANETIESSQKEYITILGIFAAVVLAFTGGIAFSTSILQNFHQSSIYRIVIVSLILGFVLINVLYALFHYIDKLVSKKDERKVKPIWFINGTLILFMIATAIAWNFGWVENRNERINNPVPVPKTTNQKAVTPSPILTPSPNVTN